MATELFTQKHQEDASACSQARASALTGCSEPSGVAHPAFSTIPLRLKPFAAFSSASTSTDRGSVRARSRQYGVRLAATAALEASSAILLAVAPVAWPSRSPTSWSRSRRRRMCRSLDRSRNCAPSCRTSTHSTSQTSCGTSKVISSTLKGSTDCYRITEEFARVPRSIWREFKARLVISLEASKAGKPCRPFRFAFPRTDCTFMVASMDPDWPVTGAEGTRMRTNAVVL